MHIGFASQDPSSHYWLIIDYGAQEQAAELGIDLTISHSMTLEQQSAAIHALIDQRVDAILIGPVAASGLAEPVERALAARIPVIVLAAQLSDCAPTCTVRSDHRQGAALAASYMVEQIGGAGEVAHLIGPRRLQDNVDRAEAVREVLAQHPGVQLAFEEESPDWMASSGAALMRAALERAPNIRGVCVANDTIALGALGALEEAGRASEIVLTGFDAMPDVLKAIHEGRMHATVSQSIRGIGQAAVDLAQRAANGESVPPLTLTDIALVTYDNLLDAALEAVYILPGVLRDAVARGQALARAQEEIIHGRDEMIRAQEATLRELSSPLIPISDRMMIMPLIGTIDSGRAQQIIVALLEGVAANATELVILDITGVPIVDTQVANALIQAAQAVRLIGAQIVLTGIRPEVAQTLVGLGVDLTGIVTRSTVQSGIAYGMARERAKAS